uniref:Uncharacterized protein n=1 Tax=Aegilops tauschii subsp. strangulata TaxID=200361 RepID=A0A453EU92_AEGTS
MFTKDQHSSILYPRPPSPLMFVCTGMVWCSIKIFCFPCGLSMS